MKDNNEEGDASRSPQRAKDTNPPKTKSQSEIVEYYHSTVQHIVDSATEEDYDDTTLEELVCQNCQTTTADAIERLHAIGASAMEIDKVRLTLGKLEKHLEDDAMRFSLEEFRAFDENLEQALLTAERKHKRHPTKKNDASQAAGDKAEGVLKFLEAALAAADRKIQKE